MNKIQKADLFRLVHLQAGDSMTRLFSNINKLKGVGEKRSKAYEKLGINTPYELLYHFPRGYTDYTQTVPVDIAPVNDYCVIKGTVVRKLSEQHIRKGLDIYKAVATDGVSDFVIVFYNNFYAFDALSENAEYYFYGRVTGNFTRKEMNSPQVIPANSPNLLQPIYHLTEGLTNAMVHTNIKATLQILETEPFEILPQNVIAQFDLCSLPYALSQIHFPDDSQSLDAAKKRLAFDELLKLQLGMLMLKGKNKQTTACIMDSSTNISEFFDNIPFELTSAQMRSINEIAGDLCRNTPMNRLLQGDVGSGKTAVAAAACYFAHKNGYQSSLMAPTEILASQHYKTLSEFLEPLGVNICLLTGSLTPKQKKDVKDQIENGTISVAVGTHAIIQKSTVFNRLGLVITDEQHRFGVAQRAALAEKGEKPHKLVMSATPIPRTLALIIYGDLDISVLDELPKGRTPVETYAVTGKLRNRAYNFIKNQLQNGRQAYIVCPMIEDSESELNAVTSYAQRLRDTDFKDFSVGLLHGKMPAQGKDTIMNDFHNGKINLLVSTTVIEVGVDVPNAVVMMIEDADRFGLSQLHQLRGRVGRGRFQSYCILVTNNPSDEVRHRLRIMSSTSDGFKISEEDLKLRGPGDFFGERQHGLPPLRIADIAADMDLMHKASNAAKVILDEDPELMLEKNSGLHTEVSALFAKVSDHRLD